MAHILIVILSWSNPTIAMAQFDSKAACEAAAQVATGMDMFRVRTKCVPVRVPE
jgi:hypothetical protein